MIESYKMEKTSDTIYREKHIPSIFFPKSKFHLHRKGYIAQPRILYIADNLYFIPWRVMKTSMHHYLNWYILFNGNYE